MPDDFESLVRRHQSAVCAAAYAVLRDRGRSEEVAQDAFLLAWQKLPAMEPAPVMPGWICGIARNLARNAGRRRGEPMPDVARVATPLDAVLDRETVAQVDRALGELAAHDREVVVMFYRGEQSIAEVAQVLQITEASVRKRLQRGRDRLRTALAAVEATLRATRPGPAFTAGCVAALAAGVGVRSASAASAASAAKSAPLAIAVGVAVLAALGGGGAWLATHAHAGATASPVSAGSAGAPAPADAARAASAASVRRLDPAARATLAGVLARAGGAHRGVASGDPLGPSSDVKVYDFSGSVLEPVAPAAEPPAGPLSKTTIRYAIRAIQPFLLECTRGHELHGTLEVNLQLSGAPDIGTLVESVDLGGDAIARADHELVSCLTETLLALELAPMDEAGTWQVSYPFLVR